MTLLIDTHILIWFLEGNSRLNLHLMELICNPDNTVMVSSVSIAEMAINTSKKKLKYPDDILRICREQGMEELPFTSNHALVLKNLPQIHLDPFDRMLIAQAIEEEITLVSQDPVISKYKVKVIN